MTENIRKIRLKDRMERCPDCDYSGGFHAFFLPLDSGRARMHLKCPSCAGRFDIGLVLTKET